MIKIIQTTIESIKKTADFFYQNNVSQGYQELVKTTQDIQVCLEAIYENDTYIQKGFSIEEVNSSLEESLVALEQRDTVLVADILIHEIADKLSELLGK